MTSGELRILLLLFPGLFWLALCIMLWSWLRTRRWEPASGVVRQVIPDATGESGGMLRVGFTEAEGWERSVEVPAPLGETFTLGQRLEFLRDPLDPHRVEWPTTRRGTRAMLAMLAIAIVSTAVILLTD